MQESTKDLWAYYDAGYHVCITTNGFVKRNGEAVMGRGTAAQAKRRFPVLAGTLGTYIGNCGWLGIYELQPRLWCFPVKPAKGISDGTNVVSSQQYRFPLGSTVPGWALKARLVIIKVGLAILNSLRVAAPFDYLVLPRPGCGAGELDWEIQVKPLCARYGDWLIVVHKP